MSHSGNLLRGPRKTSTKSILKTVECILGQAQGQINEGEHPSWIIGYSTFPAPKKSHSLLETRNLVSSISQKYQHECFLGAFLPWSMLSVDTTSPLPLLSRMAKVVPTPQDPLIHKIMVLGGSIWPFTIPFSTQSPMFQGQIYSIPKLEKRCNLKTCGTYPGQFPLVGEQGQRHDMVPLSYLRWSSIDSSG